VAKNDFQSKRGTAFVDDEQDEAFLRPASPRSRSRAARDDARQSARASAADRLLNKAADGIGEDDDDGFLRTRRRVPVRKGFLPLWTRTRWGRIAIFTAIALVLGGVIAGFLAVRHFFLTDTRFRIETSSSVQTVGNSQLTRDDLLSVFGADIGRNIFYVPLATRRNELEQIPWVEHATVMRLLPDQLRVAVVERTPIAFVRIGNQVKLVDGAGVILDMPAAMLAAKHYSFPVVSGIRPEDPLSIRAPRMKLYQRFITDIDSGGEKISPEISEIDLSDPEDVRATLPAKGSDMLLHFGDEKFLSRYHIYQSHLAEWQRNYPDLVSVDLRYDTQVVLKRGNGHSADASPQPALAAAPDPSTQPAVQDKPPAPKPAAKKPAPHKHPAPVKKHGKARR
jgi:cell division protein FtsQ